MLLTLLAQLIGFCAIFFSLSMYQTNKRLAMLALAAVAAALYAVHYFMLGALTGAALNAVVAIRSLVFIKVTPRNSTRWVLWFFMAATCAATLLTWHGPMSLLATAGSLLNGVAKWQPKTKSIRRLSLAGLPFWLVYSILAGSYPGAAIAIITMISNVVGQYRFDFRRPTVLKHQPARRS